MEAENSSTPTSRIESESESPPISQIERAGSDLDSDKEGQGPGEGAGASTTTAVAASGSTGAEKKDISGCKTDGLRRPRLTHIPTRNGRRFNVSVYQEYDWVEYSMQEDAVYCFACRHFGGASTLTGDCVCS